MADAGGDVAIINNIIRRAVEAINVQETEQVVDIEDFRLIVDGFNAQYIVDFLQRHPYAVKGLRICCLLLSPQAVEILRVFFSTTNLREISLIGGSLGNVNGGRLLSGLHGHTSVSTLTLGLVGLQGAAGGGHLSALLENNLHLKDLVLIDNNLGPEGARALQPSLANCTLESLTLNDCRLGDDGIATIANALQEIDTIQILSLDI
jgi:Leucine Rich repeat